jgi:hypothetical protein
MCAIGASRDILFGADIQLGPFSDSVTLGLDAVHMHAEKSKSRSPTEAFPSIDTLEQVWKGEHFGRIGPKCFSLLPALAAFVWFWSFQQLFLQ